MAFHPGQQASLYDHNSSRKYLNPAERACFIQAAHDCQRVELRTLCLTLAYTGCRVSEALALTPASLDRTEGFIAIRCLKKRSHAPVIRQVPVPGELLALLEHTHELTPEDTTRRLWPWTRGHAWQMVKGVMAQGGVSDGIHATPKGLRHGFGLHAIRSGVPLNLVQRWLGHASMTTTAIYLQAIGQEEREIASRMWGH